MARKKTIRYPFKRGDDFKLDFTLKDTNTAEAIAAKDLWVEELATLIELQQADPLDAAAVTAQQAVVDAAEAAYEAEILMDITGWVITSQIRLNDTLVADLVIDDSNYNIGKFALTLDKSLTQNWKIAEHDVDVSFERASGTTSSDSFIVDVQKDVTRA